MTNKSVFSLSAQDGGFNQQVSLVRSILDRANFAALVKIIAVGDGSVDVQPLVDQQDGHGNAIPHGVIYGLAYCRMQAGNSAIIIDPVPSDVGLCVFADQDITRSKKSRDNALPSSHRRNDWADGVYIMGLVGGVATTQSITLSTTGMDIVSDTIININAPVVKINGRTM